MLAVFIGVDFGTSGCRAACLNDTGDLVAESSVSYGDTAGPEEWRKALEEVVTQLPKRHDAEAICIDGTSATVMLVGATLSQRQLLEFLFKERWMDDKAELAQPDIPFPQQIPSSLPLPRFVLANSMGSLMTAASIAPAEPKAEAANPGSVWHPDLCARPCMFFQNGRCTHGSNCAFCHLNHEKRAIHLDKRNRQILKDLSGEEFLQIVLPEVRRKLDELFRSQPHLLAMLAPLMDLQRPRAIQADSRFRSAIRSMMVRQQLHYLLQKLQEAATWPCTGRKQQLS
eukprot:symbB.v1.2.010933.t2/scaffold722.1/size169129/10